ncbi:hypothetical protein HUO13_36905 [Saccharopolyspora erythraea]|uniref:hypothetical protein n=1 Tax=Saccharopolyspora erythraea TaxID=1836 RepID=UPI001BA717B7|nr:hypothetical protein [Saccharopolyspora erythraea]QUH05618.1 hypothetical protein HUO13_36905 [Saccharopolyspora erythraea]
MIEYQATVPPATVGQLQLGHRPRVEPQVWVQPPCVLDVFGDRSTPKTSSEFRPPW